MQKSILVVGNASMDMVLHMERLPNNGESLESQGSYGFLPGGRGTQVTVAMANLSAHVAFCTRLGADSHGQRLLQLLEERGVNTRYVGIDKMQNTGFSAILHTDGYDNRTVLYPGANRNISRGDIEESFLSEPDALYIQNEIPFSLTTFAAESAEMRQIPIFCELTNRDSLSDIDRLPPLEILFLNEDITEALTGIRPGSIDNSLRAGIELARRVKAHYYIMKLGSRGAFIYDGRFCHLISSYPVRKIVDTAGVGDGFSGACTVAYLQNGGDITAATRYACAAAALSLSKAGTVTSYPTDAEVRAFLAANPNP